ncbi:MAG: hypothetical protein M3P32_00935 [Chloroflexota bacterium]|nr:hypothetical protein [Chloroflexota bacterium]
MEPESGELIGRMAHLGFLLETPSQKRPGQARLLVAFRDHPTLEHFDPEFVTFWRTGDDRRGHPAELTLETRMPQRAEFSWGRIEVVDRLGIENIFATLGGELRMDLVRVGLAIAAFTSPGPILRMGGHSQDVDQVALELGAFFGRIMVPIDFEPGVEEAISAATPLERYAAFVAFEQARYVGHASLREEQPATGSAFAVEAHRLAGEDPAGWEAGGRLLSRMGLAPAG